MKGSTWIAILAILCAPMSYASSKLGPGERTSLPATSSGPNVAAKQTHLEANQAKQAVSVLFESIDFGSVEPGDSADRQVYMKGAAPGHEVSLNVPRFAKVAGAEFAAWVSSEDEVTLRYTNNSNAAQDPGGNQVYRIRVR